MRRQSRVIAIGMAITIALAAIALVRPTADGLAWRTPAVYGGTTTLFVTQTGFPWGRSALTEYVRARGGGQETAPVPRFADTGRMEYLASLYSQLALSDAVRSRVDPNRELEEDAYSVTVLSGSDGRILPLIEVVGRSESEAQAVAIANRVARSLQLYIARNQAVNGVPSETRIELPVVVRAEEASVLQGVKRTTAIMLFLLGTIVTLVIAFGRDNMRAYREAASVPVPLRSSEDIAALGPDAEEAATPSRIASAEKRASRRQASATGRSIDGP